MTYVTNHQRVHNLHIQSSPAAITMPWAFLEQWRHAPGLGSKRRFLRPALCPFWQRAMRKPQALGLALKPISIFLVKWFQCSMGMLSWGPVSSASGLLWQRLTCSKQLCERSRPILAFWNTSLCRQKLNGALDAALGIVKWCLFWGPLGLPSGNLWHSYWTWSFIVDLPITNG